MIEFLKNVWKVNEIVKENELMKLRVESLVKREHKIHEENEYMRESHSKNIQYLLDNKKVMNELKERNRELEGVLRMIKLNSVDHKIQRFISEVLTGED